MKKIRILLVEDHPIYREGLHMALTFSKLNCEEVVEASNVRQAIDYIESHPNGIDLVLLDFFLPDGTGRDILKVLKSICPKAKVLLITGETHSAEVKAMAQEGVDGIISKEVRSNQLTSIIDNIINESATPSETASESETAQPLFTKREIEVIQLCVKGLSAKDIAEMLFISPRTVEHHKERIFRKSGCNSRFELMNFAMQNKLL